MAVPAEHTLRAMAVVATAAAVTEVVVMQPLTAAVAIRRMEAAAIPAWVHRATLA